MALILALAPALAGCAVPAGDGSGGGPAARRFQRVQRAEVPLGMILAYTVEDDQGQELRRGAFQVVAGPSPDIVAYRQISGPAGGETLRFWRGLVPLGFGEDPGWQPDPAALAELFPLRAGKSVELPAGPGHPTMTIAVRAEADLPLRDGPLAVHVVDLDRAAEAAGDPASRVTVYYSADLGLALRTEMGRVPPGGGRAEIEQVLVVERLLLPGSDDGDPATAPEVEAQADEGDTAPDPAPAGSGAPL